jgi:hypothetical protein
LGQPHNGKLAEIVAGELDPLRLIPGFGFWVENSMGPEERDAEEQELKEGLREQPAKKTSALR